MIAADEVRGEIELRCVRARSPRARTFCGVCIAIRQYAIRLTGTVYSQSRHNWALPEQEQGNWLCHQMCKMSEEGWRRGRQGNQVLMPSVSFGPSDLTVVRRIFSTEVVGENGREEREKVRTGWVELIR